MNTDDPKDSSTSDGDANNNQSDNSSDTSPNENINAPQSGTFKKSYDDLNNGDDDDN
jgi:hypothetical protein